MPFVPPTDPRPVRAKFYVQEYASLGWATRVKLGAVTRGEDNKQWSAATPVGALELTITNEAAAENFAPGQEWYIDMIPVPADQVGQEGMGDVA